MKDILKYFEFQKVLEQDDITVERCVEYLEVLEGVYVVLKQEKIEDFCEWISMNQKDSESLIQQLWDSPEELFTFLKFYLEVESFTLPMLTAIDASSSYVNTAQYVVGVLEEEEEYEEEDVAVEETIEPVIEEIPQEDDSTPTEELIPSEKEIRIALDSVEEEPISGGDPIVEEEPSVEEDSISEEEPSVEEDWFEGFMEKVNVVKEEEKEPELERLKEEDTEEVLHTPITEEKVIVKQEEEQPRDYIRKENNQVILDLKKASEVQGIGDLNLGELIRETAKLNKPTKAILVLEMEKDDEAQQCDLTKEDIAGVIDYLDSFSPGIIKQAIMSFLMSSDIDLHLREAEIFLDMLASYLSDKLQGGVDLDAK